MARPSSPKPSDPSEFYRQPYVVHALERGHDPALAAFVLACHARFGAGRPPRAGVELACGPAQLSLDLAARGLAMTAVDTSPRMLARGRRRARERGLDVALRRASMVDFVPPRPVDVITNLGLNTSYILTNDAMLRHLRAVARALRPGGVYVVDVELIFHLIRRPVALDPPWLVVRTRPAHVIRGREGDERFEIQFGDTTTWFDPGRHLFRARNFLRVRGPDGVRERSWPSEGKVYFPLELEALVAQVPALQAVAWLGDYDPDCPLAGRPDATSFVLVLRRRGRATARGA